VPTNFHQVYVLRAPDLEKTSNRIREAKQHLRLAVATFWDFNLPTKRAEYLQQLANVPQIREGLHRLAQRRQRTQKGPLPTPSGKP